MRLIDADALKKWTDEHYDFEEFAVGYFVKIIQDIPTVDAVPVEWLQAHITTIEQQRLLDEWAERKEE